MLGWWSLAADWISRRKRSSTPGRSTRCPPTTLSTSSRPMSLFSCEVDDAHPAAPQLAEDLVVGVVGQAGRQGVGR